MNTSEMSSYSIHHKIIWSKEGYFVELKLELTSISDDKTVNLLWFKGWWMTILNGAKGLTKMCAGFSYLN